MQLFAYGQEDNYEKKIPSIRLEDNNKKKIHLDHIARAHCIALLCLLHRF